MIRKDGRKPDEIRPVVFTQGYVRYPEGSVMVTMGETKVLCNVTVETGVPRWMQILEKPGGWITAEYAMLPRSTHTRTAREVHGLGGRTQEIRRMIGRSLRASVDLEKLGLHTLIVDCDVIQADGGTRTAAVTGGYVALRLALQQLVNDGTLIDDVFLPPVAAISVGIVEGQSLLDLCYQEDSRAEVDINVVMNATGAFIEVQGTAEGSPFHKDKFDELLSLAGSGIMQLIEVQRNIFNA
jgi:ribonuclease PH